MSGPPPQAERVANDADVVAASLEQPELFARLYDRYAPDIHRYAARPLGETAADDITADTFLTAFRIRARYDRTRPWLYGIAAPQPPKCAGRPVGQGPGGGGSASGRAGQGAGAGGPRTGGAPGPRCASPRISANAKGLRRPYEDRPGGPHPETPRARVSPDAPRPVRLPS